MTCEDEKGGEKTCRNVCQGSAYRRLLQSPSMSDWYHKVVLAKDDSLVPVTNVRPIDFRGLVSPCRTLRCFEYIQNFQCFEEACNSAQQAATRLLYSFNAKTRITPTFDRRWQSTVTRCAVASLHNIQCIHEQRKHHQYHSP